MRPTRLLFRLLVPALTLALSGCGSDNATSDPASGPAPMRDIVVEAACGQCQFGLEGEGCTLAVRHDGTARFVTGTGIDDHGDAHAGEGFCNAVRRARVSGTVEGEVFAVTAFELLPLEQP